MLCHNADGSVTYIGSALTDKKNPELTGGSHFATVDDDESDYESENGKNKVSGFLWNFIRLKLLEFTEFHLSFQSFWQNDLTVVHSSPRPAHNRRIGTRPRAASHPAL